MNVKAPSATPYWLEIDNSTYNYCAYASKNAATTYSLKWYLYSNIHENFSNVAFVDGHVKAVNNKEWTETGSTGAWQYHFRVDVDKTAW